MNLTLLGRRQTAVLPYQFKILLPDVSLLDIRMPEESGLQVLEKIRQVKPDAKIVMLSSFDDDEYVDTALRAGLVVVL